MKKRIRKASFVYIVEYRLRKRMGVLGSAIPPTAWRPALGMFPATQHKGQSERWIDQRGMTDTTEYRVVRYVREAKRVASYAPRPAR